MTTKPGGQPGQIERPPTQSPPNKPGQYEDPRNVEKEDEVREPADEDLPKQDEPPNRRRR